MTVAFDAVGPAGGAGQGNLATATLSWTHTAVGSPVLILAGIALGAATNDAPYTLACTCDGSAMTDCGAGKIHANAGNQGFLQVFTIGAQTSGAHTILATVTGGAPTSLSAGSVSTTGGATLGTPATGASSGSTATKATTGSTSGNLVVGFAAAGSAISSATSPSTSRFIQTESSGSGAGNSAGATSPGTGSAVTMAWAISAFDLWAEILVEVQAGTIAGLASGAGAAQAATIATSSLSSGPRYAGTATDLGGGYGVWATPQYAQGGP